MIATLWLADVGGVRGLLFRPPPASAADGLRFSSGGVATRLRTSLAPRLVPGRATWFALWDDEAAIGRFVAERPRMQSVFAEGCRLQLLPDRIIQRNVPGFDTETWRAEPSWDGPVMVVTVSRPKFHRLPRFLIAAVHAERAAAGHDELRWAMGFSRPPGAFATVTLWDSAGAAARYAYSGHDHAHRHVMEREAKRWFAATINFRLRLASAEGELGDDSLRRHFGQLA